MATTENNGLLTYKDEAGDKHLLYPVTKAELVDGLEEAINARFTDGYKAMLDGTADMPEGGEYVGGVKNGGEIEIDALGQMNIKDDAVTTTKIMSGSVTVAKLSSGFALPTDKLADGAVTLAKLADDVTAGALGGATITKLWENASPTSAFEAQAIALSLKEGDRVKVIGIGNNAKKYLPLVEVPVGQSGQMLADMGYRLVRRQFEVTKTGVAFENATEVTEYGITQVSNSALCVPMEIWLIKGVQ